MKIFLAGCEQPGFLRLTTIAKHPYVLFSYYHYNQLGKKAQSRFLSIIKNSGQQVICDSGLFTLMFGAGKGGDYNHKFMEDYTAKYIDTIKSLEIPNLTIVESDVHKLLGMESVFKLRKQFLKSGFDTIYVWHFEEGIDGLLRMSDNYDYIALSVPELRQIFKGKKIRYQDAVWDLLNKLHRHRRVVPRIHLLGNTIQETMETDLAYSCDSTSWESGGRWGSIIKYIDGRLKTIKFGDSMIDRYNKLLQESFPEQWAEIEHYWPKEKTRRYMVSMYISCKTYRVYQDLLDKKYTFKGARP